MCSVKPTAFLALSDSRFRLVRAVAAKVLCSVEDIGGQLRGKDTMCSVEGV